MGRLSEESREPLLTPQMVVRLKAGSVPVEPLFGGRGVEEAIPGCSEN